MWCVMALLVSACGSDKEPMRPVDGKFRATVEGSDDPGVVIVGVDVYWAGDGRVDVRLGDGLFPGGLPVLKGVVLNEGNEVLNEGPVDFDGGADPHQVRLEGVIAPEALDLELTVTPPDGTPY